MNLTFTRTCFSYYCLLSNVH